MRTDSFDSTESQERMAESQAYAAKQLADKKAADRIRDAAPELLKSLTNLMKSANAVAEMADLDPSHSLWAWIEDASDAIAKTEGKE